jgi:hypothetical protein
MSAPAGFAATGLATLWIICLAVAATAPALFGSGSLGPESLLDADPLYARAAPPSSPGLFDPTRAYFDVPRDFAAADGFQQGRFDLWNPRVGLGIPLWSDGGALFLPAKIPFYLSPSRRTYDVATTLRLVVAGLGAFLLARRRGLAPVPAAAAGTLFELSGAILATLPFGEEAPPCLLPWVLLGAEVIAQNRLPAAAAATGVALGLAGASGHVMFVVVVWAGFGVAIAGHALASWRRPRTALRIVALATLAVAIGLALAAPALLPVLEAQAVGRQYKTTSIYERQLVRFLSEARATFPVALLMPFTVDRVRTVLAPAVGGLGLAFAVAGLLRRGLDPALVAVALFGVGLTLAPPVLGWVRQIPIIHYVYPMYAWSLVALPVTQAAGQGVAALSVPTARWTILGGLAVLLAGVAALMLVKVVFPATALGVLVGEVVVQSLGDRTAWIRAGLSTIVLPLAVVALVVGTRTRFRNRCAVAATALVGLELVVFVAPSSWFRDSATLASPPSPAVRFLQHVLRDGQYRMLGWPLTLGSPATTSLFGLADVRGVGPLPVERYVRYLEAIAPHAPWYVWQYPGRVLRHPLLDLASVRHVVVPADSTPTPLLQDDAMVRLVFRDERVSIYENHSALPRARVVYQAVAVRDQDEAFRRLVDAAAGSPHAAAGLADRLFLEPSADGGAPAETTSALLPYAESVRMVAGADPDQVELEANLPLPGWVVLADTFYPGWTATIDGVPTPIHPANLLFRAVFVPAGEHRIVYRYQPTVFRVGLALAAAGLIAVGLLLVRQRRLRNPSVSSAAARSASSAAWASPIDR